MAKIIKIVVSIALAVVSLFVSVTVAEIGAGKGNGADKKVNTIQEFGDLLTNFMSISAKKSEEPNAVSGQIKKELGLDILSQYIESEEETKEVYDRNYTSATLSSQSTVGFYVSQSSSSSQTYYSVESKLKMVRDFKMYITPYAILYKIKGFISSENKVSGNSSKTVVDFDMELYEGESKAFIRVFNLEATSHTLYKGESDQDKFIFPLEYLNRWILLDDYASVSSVSSTLSETTEINLKIFSIIGETLNSIQANELKQSGKTFLIGSERFDRLFYDIVKAQGVSLPSVAEVKGTAFADLSDEVVPKMVLDFNINEKDSNTNSYATSSYNVSASERDDICFYNINNTVITQNIDMTNILYASQIDIGDN